MFSEIMRYILDLGPTVMLPIVIIIFSKLLGMKLGDCFKSGLHIGIRFRRYRPGHWPDARLHRPGGKGDGGAFPD